MIYIKYIQIFLIATLLFTMQPLMAFSINSTESIVVNHQEGFSLFKTKSSKALVLHEVSIQTIEISESLPFNYQGKYTEILSALSKKKHLLSFDSHNSDKKHLLTSQIFPFHFHF